MPRLYIYIYIYWIHLLSTTSFKTDMNNEFTYHKTQFSKQHSCACICHFISVWHIDIALFFVVFVHHPKLKTSSDLTWPLGRMNFQPPSRDWESKDESKAILKSVMWPVVFCWKPYGFCWGVGLTFKGMVLWKYVKGTVSFSCDCWTVGAVAAPAFAFVAIVAVVVVGGGGGGGGGGGVGGGGVGGGGGGGTLAVVKVDVDVVIVADVDRVVDIDVVAVVVFVVVAVVVVVVAVVIIVVVVVVVVVVLVIFCYCYYCCCCCCRCCCRLCCRCCGCFCWRRCWCCSCCRFWRWWGFGILRRPKGFF